MSGETTTPSESQPVAAAHARTLKYEYPPELTPAQKKAFRRDARKAAKAPPANTAEAQGEALIGSMDNQA